LLSLTTFSEEDVLGKINELRGVLNGQKLSMSELSPEKIKEGLSPSPYSTRKEALTVQEVENTIKEICDFVHKKDELVIKENELKEVIIQILKDIKLKQYSLYKKLFETAMKLIDETNTCPLCGRKWEKGDFKTFLEERTKETDVAQEKQTKVNDISYYLKQKIDLLKNDIVNLVKAHTQFNLKSIDKKREGHFLSEITSWADILSNPIERFENNQWPSSDISVVFDQSFLISELSSPLEDVLKKIGETYSKNQMAWDTLTKMEDRWKRYREDLGKKEMAGLFKKRAEFLLIYFEEARDFVLENIYDAIKDNFNEYYKTIHAEDEKSFSSQIKHIGAELIFEVDFYGRGLFPPHALHSEGHQDSMGLCLFFALNKYLTQDRIKTVVLDDVVMSIDRNHRRGVCSLLKKHFPDRQFIITTHDTAWAKQLKTESVVKLKNMLHFVNWNIETGPIFELEKDLWEKIKDDLQKDDIPAAAHKLRYNAECYFENVCDFLNARIPYKGHHQWELSDFAPAAISAYKEYLKKAKANFQILKQVDKINELGEYEATINDIINRSQVEQWVINASVHYNKWQDFSKNDFEPVVKVFQELFSLFTCSKCGTIISISYSKGTTPKAILSCGCGSFFWNLEQ
jgi:energy-coupling factor transporter ATP-binding protein EcfA2